MDTARTGLDVQARWPNNEVVDFPALGRWSCSPCRGPVYNSGNGNIGKRVLGKDWRMSNRISFRVPFVSHLWSKGLMTPKTARHEWPEHLRGDSYYDQDFPIPEPPSYRTDEQVGLNDSTTHAPRRDESVASVEPVESFKSVESVESIESTLPEYLTAVWEKVKTKPPPLAADGYVLGMRDLVSLCFHLQTLAKEGTFYLACRHVGQLLGIDFRKASKMLHKLENDKIIGRISKGTVKVRPGQKTKANEYRYIGGA